MSNRYAYPNQMVNKFRSNLMLLVQNMFVEGLPVERIGKEYKRFFHDDVSAERMYVELGLNEGLTYEPGKDWSRIFNFPTLYEFFQVVTQPSTGLQVVTCKRGRTVIEMKVLAQLASYSNIETVRATDRRRHKLMNFCQDCNAVMYSDSKENAGKRKYLEYDDEEGGPGFFMEHCDSCGTSSQTSSTLKSHCPGSNSELDAPDELLWVTPKDASSGVVKIRNDNPTVIDNDDISQVLVVPVVPVPDNSGHAATVITFSDTVQDSQKIKTSVSQSVSKLASRVIRNHLGEFKVIKYLAVEQTCKYCNKSFPDEGVFAEHKRLCPISDLKCKSCDKQFSSKTQLRGHALFCVAEEQKKDNTSEKEQKADDQRRLSPIIVKYEIDLTEKDFTNG